MFLRESAVLIKYDRSCAQLLMSENFGNGPLVR